jgi:hypothetical protein
MTDATAASPIGNPALNSDAKTQAENAIIAAGDRSISPEMMISVSTSAIIAYST